MQVHRAVNDAEAVSGLQFCVVRLGPGKGELLARAVALFDAYGLPQRPAVLVAVERESGEIDVALGPAANGRLDERIVSEVLDACESEGDVVTRTAAVILTLADRAGAGRAEHGGAHLPDVIEV